MGDALGLIEAQLGERWVVAGDSLRRPVGLAVTDEEEVHTHEDRALPSHRQYDGAVANADLVTHLKDHALRTDGPFTLRSGVRSGWYLDARQTTFDGAGAATAAQAVMEILDPAVEAVGGMTMGADPIAVATALVATSHGRSLRAFSIRKADKGHGTGGRLVGPVSPGDHVAILEDTTTTGGAAAEAATVAVESGLEVIQVIALVDRSGGAAAARFEHMGLPYMALVVPADLGVTE